MACKVKAGLSKVWSGIKKPFRWIKGKFAKPAAFFAEGRRGGCVAMAALGSQFTYAGMLCGMFSLHTIIPKALLLVLSVPFYLVTAWLLRIALRLLSAKTGYSKVFFLLTWFITSVFPIIASQGEGIGGSLLIAFALTLAADILGRVLWSALRKVEDDGRRRSILGYIAGAAALAALVAFAVFFRLQTFGDDLIAPYLADKEAAGVKSVSEKAGEDFAGYIAPGGKKVLVMDYGTSDDCDIATGTVDISEFAEREGLSGSVMDKYWDYSLDKAPVAGRIWYPEDAENCPAMFIVHGNHDYDVPSYLGYDYLGEYLASHGYVVISVDENSCNGLGDENDARAVLLLENMKTVFRLNKDSSSPIRGFIDESRVAIAGHSRGGEMVATAYYFNDLDVYPDNGTIKFSYHFPIKSIIAIAPVCDQYMPAGRPVEIEDVNYLVLHGSNDQDVSSMFGEKQLHNVTFTGEKRCFKASVYMMGANHGQFNNQWGSYDLIEGANQFLNVNNFIEQDDQQQIAKVYIKTFLDATVRGYAKYKSLFYDYEAYSDYLPETVYITTCEDSDFVCINSFDDDADLQAATMDGAVMKAEGVDKWAEELRVRGSGGEGENHVLRLTWGADETSGSDARPVWEPDVPASIAAMVHSLAMSGEALVFDICDMREEEDLGPVSYTVTLTDGSGNKAAAENPVYIYPSLKVQLSKMEAAFGGYGYRHQLQTVMLRPEQFTAGEGFDATDVVSVEISFPEMESGDVQLDRLGLEKAM